MTNPPNSLDALRARYGAAQAQPQGQPAPQTPHQAAPTPQPAPDAPAQPEPYRPQPLATGDNNYSASLVEYTSGSSERADDTYSFPVGESMKTTRTDGRMSKEGWRGFLNNFGLSLSQSPREREWSEWISRINRPTRYPAIIGVVSAKGGQTKSTTVINVASAIANERGGTVAVDTDASSTLVQRVSPVSGHTTTKSIAAFAMDDQINTNTDIAAYMNINEMGLHVLGGVALDSVVPVLTEDLAVRALLRLARTYSFIFVDFPGAREAPIVDEMLPLCDALLLVTTPKPGALASAHHYLRDLSRRHPKLIATTMVLVAQTDTRNVIVDLDAEVAQFRRELEADGKTRLYHVPFDEHLGDERPVDFDRVSDRARRQFTEIAADLVSMLPTDNLTNIERLSQAVGHN